MSRGVCVECTAETEQGEDREQHRVVTSSGQAFSSTAPVPRPRQVQ